MYRQRPRGPPRRDVVEGLAGSLITSRAMRASCGTARHEQRAAPVVHRQRQLDGGPGAAMNSSRIVTTPRIERSARGRIGWAVGAPRRQRGQHAAVVSAQLLDDLAPLRAVHHQARA